MISYSDSHDIDPQQLLALFEQADWAEGRCLHDIQQMLTETDVTITAWDGSKLVGFGRVLTDYVYRASVWDVIVDRTYQDQDIGKGLVRSILTHDSLAGVELRGASRIGIACKLRSSHDFPAAALAAR